MSPLFAQRWHGLQRRERGLIVIGAVVVIAAVVFQWLIEPVIQGRAQLTKTLPPQRAEILALSARSEAIRLALEAQKAQRKNVSETALREHLNGFKLTPAAVRIAGEAVSLEFSRADLAQVLVWSAAAAPVFGLSVKTLEAGWASAGVADIKLGLAP